MTKKFRLLTVKQYAADVHQHPKSVYRRVSKGTQQGVVRVGNGPRATIRIRDPRV